MEKQEKVILALTVILIIAVASYLSNALMAIFYVAMGEDNYEIRLDVLLYPVENQRGDLIDVDVRFEAQFSKVRIPHEVVGWDKKEKIASGRRLFIDQQGGLSLSLDLKIENFTTTVYSCSEQITLPLNYTIIIYSCPEDAQDNTVLQLSVYAEKHLVLNTLKDAVEKKWMFVEKWEI